MSLIIAVYVPTGVALSGDSRTTGTVTQTITSPSHPAGTPASSTNVQTNIVISDAAEKVFLVHDRFGIGTFGEAIVNNLPIAHYVKRFQSQHSIQSSTTTVSLANDLLAFFRALNPTPNVSFIVVGYDGTDPWVVVVEVQNNQVSRVNVQGGSAQIDYGIVRGGDTAVVDRLLSQPQFNPIFNVMNLQDAVDFSRHLIRSTIDQMRFEPRFATVGGAIDTLIVSPALGKFLAHKELRCA